MVAPVLPPIGDDVKAWGISLMTYLRKQLPKLYHLAADDNPSEDGVVLWDRLVGNETLETKPRFTKM